MSNKLLNHPSVLTGPLWSNWGWFCAKYARYIQHASINISLLRISTGPNLLLSNRSWAE